MMLNRFSAKHYRNLNIEDIQFGRVNVLIGPNNSGKSNFIDAINFVSSLLANERSTDSPQDTAMMNELDKRGWSDVFDRRAMLPGSVELKWELSEANKNMPPLSYQLSFRIPGPLLTPPEGYGIIREKLENAYPFPGEKKPYFYFDCHERPGTGIFSVRPKGDGGKAGKSGTRTIELSDQDTVLNQLDDLQTNDVFLQELYPNFQKAAKEVKQFFTKFRSYSSTNIDLSRVRLPVKHSQSRYLSADGSNFVNVLIYLENKYQFLSEYKRHIKKIIHMLDNIEIRKIDDNFSILYLKIGGHEYKLSEMSDGTIKAMLLALLLWTPEKYSLLSLDEPELNIHPAWLKVIAHWIVSSASADQIFVSSHSPDLLDGFTEEFSEGTIQLFAFSTRDENSLRKVSPEAVHSQLRNGWDLGDLYRIGEPLIGGWPW